MSKKTNIVFWLHENERQRKQIRRYRNWLILELSGSNLPFIVILVKKCRSGISRRRSVEKNERAYALLLEIVYGSILLFYALKLEGELEVWKVQDLFGSEFDLRGDIQAQASAKLFSVDEFVSMPYLLREPIRQQRLIRIFIQIIRPKLDYLDERFKQEVEIEDSGTIDSCWDFVIYLKYWIQQFYRWSYFYDD